MKSLLTNQERIEFKRKLIKTINKDFSLCNRLLLLLLGFVAIFNPGLVFEVGLIKLIKEIPPENLELLRELSDEN